MARRRNRKVYNALDRKGKVQYTKQLKALIGTMSKDLKDGNITREELLQHKAFKHYTPDERENLDEKEIVDTLAEYAVVKRFADELHITVDESQPFGPTLSKTLQEKKTEMEQNIDELKKITNELNEMHDNEIKSGNPQAAAEINLRINKANEQKKQYEKELYRYAEAGMKSIKDVEELKKDLNPAPASPSPSSPAPAPASPSSPPADVSVLPSGDDVVHLPERLVSALELVAANVINL